MYQCATYSLAPRLAYVNAKSLPTPELAPRRRTRSSSGLIVFSLEGSGRALSRRKRIGMARRYMSLDGILGWGTEARVVRVGGSLCERIQGYEQGDDGSTGCFAQHPPRFIFLSLLP